MCFSKEKMKRSVSNTVASRMTLTVSALLRGPVLYAAFVEKSSAIKDMPSNASSFPGASLLLHEAVSKLDGMDLRSNAEKRAAAGFIQQDLGVVAGSHGEVTVRSLMSFFAAQDMLFEIAPELQ